MEKMISPHDKFFKMMMRNSQVAASFFRSMLPTCIFSVLELSTLELVPSHFIDKDFSACENDLLYRAKRIDCNNDALIYLLIEHQSKPDKLMPLRILSYMTKVLITYVEKTNQSVLPVVYPLIVYNGKRHWYYSLDFFDLFEKDADMMRSYFFKPDLIDVCRMDQTELLEGNLSSLMLVSLKRVSNKVELQEKLIQLNQLLYSCGKTVTRKILIIVIKYTMISFIIDHGSIDGCWPYFKRAFLPEYQEVAMNLAQALEKRGFQQGMQAGVERGMERGLQKGMRKGVKRGIRHGVQQGMQQGMQKGLFTTAQRLHDAGMDAEFIFEMTGISIKALIDAD